MSDEHLPAADITRSIIGGFYSVYNCHGYGLLESIYAASLERELQERGLRVSREFAVEVMYKGHPVGFQRLDMVVASTIIVEIKSTPAIHPEHKRQVISYLKATRLPIGLLLHFGPTPKVYRLFGADGPFGAASIK
jgi:GxxExxY protein